MTKCIIQIPTEDKGKMCYNIQMCCDRDAPAYKLYSTNVSEHACLKKKITSPFFLGENDHHHNRNIYKNNCSMISTAI